MMILAIRTTTTANIHSVVFIGRPILRFLLVFILLWRLGRWDVLPVALDCPLNFDYPVAHG